jgi:hypothetical protein
MTNREKRGSHSPLIIPRSPFYESEVALKTRSWKRAARAACFIVAAVLACHMVAAVGARTTRAAHDARPCVREAIVRGRGLLTFGGYELNVTFTTAGRLVCFDISDADATPSTPPA